VAGEPGVRFRLGREDLHVDAVIDGYVVAEFDELILLCEPDNVRHPNPGESELGQF